MVPIAAPVQPIEPPSTAPKSDEAKNPRNGVRSVIPAPSNARLGHPPAEAVVARLTELVHPATLAQVSYFHGLGWRTRLLTLPVMVALVLSWLWWQIGSINEWVRVLTCDQRP
jgi:hypothetical protein